jgi:hypothetical protein
MTDDGQWEWTRADPNTRAISLRSAGTFRSLLDCINDAKQHGYSEDSTSC